MSPELIISFASVIVASIAIFFAWKSAREAHIANDKSEEANKIARQALDLQRRLAPAPWSEIIRSSATKNLIKNTSGHNSIITSIEAIPESASWLLKIDRSMPIRVNNGDSFQLKIERATLSVIESIKIKWHYEDDPDSTHEIIRNVN